MQMILTTPSSTFPLTLVPHSKMNLASKIAISLVLALAAGNVSKIIIQAGVSGIHPETKTVRIGLF